jgi:lysophospholipase L1-like esterase
MKPLNRTRRDAVIHRNFFVGITLLPLLLLLQCKTAAVITHPATSLSIGYYGRTLPLNQEQVLIGSASYGEFMFDGDSCVIYLRNIAPHNNYNYVSIEVDNQYFARWKVDGSEARPFAINTAGAKTHIARIYKATEAQNGQVVVTGIRAQNLRRPARTIRKKIEFIGNSITCGMGNDVSEIPCGTGQWYDQHNAYFAYGPLLSRTLNLDFMLSAVSGIGIYRTWNGDAPNMPGVYESAYLHPDSIQRWNFASYKPDIVSICLGTNDLSDGDGKTARPAFDSSVFINRYATFIETLYKFYPNTQIVLLNSPMISGPKDDLLVACLNRVRDISAARFPATRNIRIFRFQPMAPKGCSYHPSKEDHMKMANELKPFMEEVVKSLN